MRKSLLALSTAAIVALPGALTAQGFGVAARAGTLGLGAEAAVGLSDALVLRGGLGLMPLEPSATIDDIDFTLTLPETWFNVGADLYLSSSVRIGGGMMFKPDDPTLVAEITGTQTITIGDQTYSASELVQVDGILDSKDQAPYVLIGFGKHTKSGIGLFLDLGAAFIGEPTVSLTASGPVANEASVQAELRKQETNIENDLGTYLKVWPIINIGLKIGVGG